MIDRIARAVDRSTARERNEKQVQGIIQHNQTLLCLLTMQKTGQAAHRDSVQDSESDGHPSWAARLGAAAGSTRTRPSSTLGARR